MFYDQFLKLCKESNIRPAKVARDLGLNQSTISTWKSQGTMPNAVTLIRLAEYFNTTPAYLAGNDMARDPIKKDASPEISDEDIMFALFDGDVDEITDEMYEEVKQFAQFIKEKKKRDAQKKDAPDE